MVRFLSICVILASISGCCTPVAHAPIGMPPGPNLEPITQEMWQEAPPELQRVLNENGLEWERFYDRVKERQQIHDRDQ